MSKPRRMTDLRTVPADPPSDEVALVGRARDGDVDAFAELVRRYQRRAVSVSYRLLGNVEDASDVSQDAFVRAYRSISQLDDPARFGGWLMRVVCNLSLNFRRSRATRAAVPLDDAVADSSPLRAASGSSPASPLEPDADGPVAGELHEAIVAGLDELPEKQRLALVLFSVEGLPQKEVAEILECSVELVKWNVFQARQKMREHLRGFL